VIGEGCGPSRRLQVHRIDYSEVSVEDRFADDSASRSVLARSSGRVGVAVVEAEETARIREKDAVRKEELEERIEDKLEEVAIVEKSTAMAERNWRSRMERSVS
jgi:hypothetical protein